MPTPILLISDDPSGTSGLARITRDLCTLLSGMPEFRVGSLGWMGTGSARLHWPQYRMQAMEFGEYALPAVWDEFCQGQRGIIFTVWDATRLLWLAQPQLCEHKPIAEWLSYRRSEFKWWGYFPFDACGPNNKFTALVRDVLLGCDRILVPSPIALGWVRNTIGEKEFVKRGAEWMPHGINTKTFHS